MVANTFSTLILFSLASIKTYNWLILINEVKFMENKENKNISKIYNKYWNKASTIGIIIMFSCTILASIFRGLNKISTETLFASSACFIGIIVLFTVLDVYNAIDELKNNSNK